MKFLALGQSDARLIEVVVHGDNRGNFARTWCANSFTQHGIDFSPVQGNTSVTRVRGTVRGMHFQRTPKPDSKIVRCTSGRIYDVIADLRASSTTRGQVYINELTPGSAKMLYIPAGFAHGFQTLSDDTVVEYLMGTEYVADLSDGFRYDDPMFGIVWPLPVTEISAKDVAWPLLAERGLW
jgi:dTDP-4-dehydrorhamnose 3,5-epimerase